MAKYKCPQCEAVLESEQPVNCAACNVPMVEETVETPVSSESASTQEQTTDTPVQDQK